LSILHITYDLRDRHNREKTSAVRNLIKLNQNFSNISVIDILRTPILFEEKSELISQNHLVIDSFGLPFGLLFRMSQNRVVKKIYDADSSGLFRINSTKLIHSHKMTFDGYVGYQIALKYDLPFIVTVRQTDTMVLNKKRGLIKHFKPLIIKCEKIFYLIPQITLRLEKILGTDFFEKHIKDKLVFLPNIVERKTDTENKHVVKNNFVTVLRMDKRSVKRKNLKRLLLGFKKLNNREFKLKIIGTGDYMYKVMEWVDELELKDRITFLGKVENSLIDEHYANAEAFLLPSISESFGMVYAEALMNGTPIMYSKDRLGFDGMFEGVGVGVDPLSVDSIAEGIKNLSSNSTNFRSKIRELDNNNAFDVFSSEYINNKYKQIISSIIG